MSDAPLILHAFEQMAALHKDLAECLATYHRDLIINGFTREEALMLVIARQHDLLTPPQPNPE